MKHILEIVYLISDSSGSKTGEGLLNLNQFCTQYKSTSTRRLKKLHQFDQFGKRTEASSLSRRNLVCQSRVWQSWLIKKIFCLLHLSKDLFQIVVDSAIGLILLRIVSCSWFNERDTSFICTAAKPSAAGWRTYQSILIFWSNWCIIYLSNTWNSARLLVYHSICLDLLWYPQCAKNEVYH